MGEWIRCVPIVNTCLQITRSSHRSSGLGKSLRPFPPPPLFFRRQDSYAQAASPPSPPQHIEPAAEVSRPGLRPSADKEQGLPGIARSTRLGLGDADDQTTSWTKTMIHTSTTSTMGRPSRRGRKRSPRFRCCPLHSARLAMSPSAEDKYACTST